MSLPTPTQEERQALARFFGTKTPAGQTLSIDLARLESVLRDGELAPSLRAAVELLTGPLSNHKAERAALDERWSLVFLALREHPSATPPLSAWLSDIHSSGLLRRLAGNDPDRGKALAQSALAVASRLPQESIGLPALAAAATGDSHALDRGAPLGLLCLRVAACMTGRPSPTTAQARRDTWAAVGVLCDELSAPVLTLNLLLGSSASSLGVASRAHAADGEPYRVSIRQLLRHAPTLINGAPTSVFVCENPAVIASAASALGPACAPMVCVEGHPRTASKLLLQALRNAGARLHYHGDFDWSGIQIANAVMGSFGAVPWQMSTNDYRCHAPKGSALRGRLVRAQWDDELASAMLAARRRVHEEQVLDRLLPDLDAR